MISIFTVILLLVGNVAVGLPEEGVADLFFTARVAEEIHIWDGTVADDFARGKGTQDNPYIIAQRHSADRVRKAWCIACPNE